MEYKTDKVGEIGYGGIIASVSDKSLLIVASKPLAAPYGWNNAIEELKTFTLEGYRDWRLPTAAELLVIANTEALFGLLAPFRGTHFWTADMPDHAYAFAGFLVPHHGFSSELKVFAKNVLPVRTQTPKSKNDNTESFLQSV